MATDIHHKWGSCDYCSEETKKDVYSFDNYYLCEEHWWDQKNGRLG